MGRHDGRSMGRRYEPQRALGLAVREMRTAAGLTQKQLAERSTVDATWLSRLERSGVNPAYGTLKRLATGLGVELETLVRRADELEQSGPPE